MFKWENQGKAWNIMEMIYTYGKTWEIHHK
jgi:hypothetical protein